MRTAMVAIAMALAMEAAQAMPPQPDSSCGRLCKKNMLKVSENIARLLQDAFKLDAIDPTVMGPCGIGRPKPWGGDVPGRV